jgi:hypothetical protein
VLSVGSCVCPLPIVAGGALCSMAGGILFYHFMLLICALAAIQNTYIREQKCSFRSSNLGSCRHCNTKRIAMLTQS